MSPGSDGPPALMRSDCAPSPQQKSKDVSQTRMTGSGDRGNRDNCSGGRGTDSLRLGDKSLGSRLDLIQKRLIGWRDATRRVLKLGDQRIESNHAIADICNRRGETRKLVLFGRRELRNCRRGNGLLLLLLKLSDLLLFLLQGHSPLGGLRLMASAW